jgi:sugar phosphate isomerase/epimerase
MFTCLAPGAIGVKANLTEGLDYAANCGFQGLDVNMKEVSGLVEEHGPDHVKTMFSDKGLRIGAWGLGFAWNGPEDVFKEGLDELSRLAAAGKAIGATRVSQWVPPASDDLPFRENFRFHVTRFRAVSEILAEYGCRLGLEHIGPRTLRDDKKYGFIYTQAGMLALSEAIGTGNVGLLLDAWHWFTGLGTVSDLRSLTNEDVVYVHVNDAPKGVHIADQIDNKRALPSETGVIDLVAFLKVLKDIGYDGPVTAEPFSQRVRDLPADQAVSETHAGLAKAWEAAGI